MNEAQLRAAVATLSNAVSREDWNEAVMIISDLINESTEVGEAGAPVPSRSPEQMARISELARRLGIRDGRPAPTGATTGAVPAKPYIQQILETPIDFPVPIVTALRHFKRHHKLGNESNESRLQGMRDLLNEIAVTGGCPIPALRMEHINGESSGSSQYIQETHTIVMRGKLSIITFLHECAHAVYGYDEHMSRAWSINLFKRVYPKAFARLQVEGGDDGFYLSLRTESMVAPVVANGSQLSVGARVFVDGTADASGNLETIAIGERSNNDARETTVDGQQGGQ